MSSKLLFLLLTFLFSQSMLQANTVQNYYIKINGTQKKGYTLEYGTVQVDGSTIKLKKLPVNSIADLNVHIADQCLTDYDFNLYIHGMWADNSLAWKDTYKQLHRDVYKKRKNNQVVVSIIWDAAVIYAKSVEKARHKGAYLSKDITTLLHAQKEHHISVLAHSMGNRVWQYIVKDNLPAEDKIVDSYLVLGADLEADIFESGKPLEHLPSLCKEITVYMHNTDRTLMISSYLNDCDRLGLSGIQDSLLQHEAYRLIDVSTIEDGKGLSSIANHRYFYTSESVREDMLCTLESLENENRSELSCSSHLKLKTSKKVSN